jgi:cardiolipin synthase
MARQLILLPDDSARPILEAIRGAERSLRIKMFAFSHPALVKAVVAAKRRGIKVQVMLSPTRRNGEQNNEGTRKALERVGVAIKDGNPAFDLTHEKSMVVDDTVAFVTSLNWTTKNLTATRDYAVVTDHKHEVSEIIDCFVADWHRDTFEPRRESHLVWCPGLGRDRICRFIDGAKHRLFVENERVQDAVVIERLVRAAQRGVKVHVMARPPHTLNRDKLVEGVGGLRILDDVGIKVHKLKHLKLHGKMMLADDMAALVGSMNLAARSLDGRRELAIEVHDDNLVSRLCNTARHDWERSHPFDLSDEGLLADLEDRIEDSSSLLAIEN